MTDEERARVRAHLLALGYVVVAAALKKWLGPAGSPFVFFTAAVALATWYGGIWPGAVALLASILVVDVAFVSTTATVSGPWTAFAVEALAVAWLVARLRDRLSASNAELDAAFERIHETEASERHARLINSAFDHLASLTDDTAAIVLNAQGLITVWTAGAARLYRCQASEMLGTGVQALFGAATPAAEWRRLLTDAATAGGARWSGVHRRHDGVSFDADVEVRDARPSHAFTLVVRDLTRERQWDAFRAASARSETALQTDVEVMRQQLAALESVTDPALDPLRRDDLGELLERLRLAVDADGVAFVQPGGVRGRAITANGLQPDGLAPRGLTDLRRSTGRVMLVQNDAARVAQLSVCAWPDTVSCLILVPVVVDGQLRAVIEVVNERSRRSTDADMALIRVVASRVAPVGQHGLDEAGAVA